MTACNALIAKIKQQKMPEWVDDRPNGPLPVVSLEEFFEGNDDYGSIGCNLDMPYETSDSPRSQNWLRRILRPELPIPIPTAPHPGPQGFYKVLQAVREREDVQDILVEIADTDGANDASWPYSECVYILSAASAQEVQTWIEVLFPDTVEEGYLGEKPPAAPDLLPGYKVYAAWWD